MTALSQYFEIIPHCRCLALFQWPSPSPFLCFPGFSRAFFFDRTLTLGEDDTASWPQPVYQHCYTSVWSKHSQGQDCLSTCFAKLVQSQEANSSTCVVYQSYTIQLYKSIIKLFVCYCSFKKFSKRMRSALALHDILPTDVNLILLTPQDMT